MIKNYRKGNGYVEIAVVVAILLVITLFAIPRYQDLKRDTYRAQITNDSRLVETYVIEHDLKYEDMPNRSIELSDEDLKDIVDSKKSYFKGDILTSTDIDSIGGVKYQLNKEEILKHLKTKLKGDFIYTDKGVIYVDKAKSVKDDGQNDIDIEDLENMIGPVKQVSMNDYHSAAITESGDLYTWGRGSYGRLGHGDTSSRNTPTKVDGISNVKQVALGHSHSAAIIENGDLYTWGNNNYGQLGHKNKDNINIPTKVEGISNVKQVALGSGYSAAITENGDLYTWGKGADRQLGHGDEELNDVNTEGFRPASIQTIPKKVNFFAAKNTKIKQVALGNYHSAAITESGDLYTWGSGNDGRLGHRNKDDKNTPTKVVGISNVKQIALGDSHSAAVTEGGDLYTWGKGWYGQLGHGDTLGRSIPIKISGISNVKQVSLGYFHSAAITESGNLYTWGRSHFGQLGHGDIEDKHSPTLVIGISSIKDIILGFNHSAVITEDSDLYTWGNGDYGKLGHGDEDDINTPKKVEFSKKL